MIIAMVEPQALRGCLNEAKPVVVDVLVDEHFKALHLPGAINVCVYEIVFLENMAKLVPDREREIVLCGAGGGSLEALDAAAKLVNAGYRNISVLQGGLAAWRAQGYPVEGEEAGLSEGAEPALPFDDGRYAVDVEQSVIDWFGRNRTTTHHGTLRLASGEFSFRGGELTGHCEVDMTSIRNIDLTGDPLQPQLIGHLKSADFFFVEMFPRATFTITAAKRIDAALSSPPNFSVRGIFNLRGVKQEIAFRATASPPQGGEIRIESHFDIDRTRWGVLYGSSRFFEHLGYHLVYHPVSLQLRLVARSAP